MRVMEKFNPQQMVPCDSKDNKMVAVTFSDGSKRWCPEFLLVGVLKEGMDIAYCMWRHTDRLFYINWMRQNRINSQFFQYMETLEDDEFRVALKVCSDERIIKVAESDMIWLGNNNKGFDPTTIKYEIHPSMFNEPYRETKNVDYHRRGKPVFAWNKE